MSRNSGILREALSLVRPRLLLQQLAIAAVFSVLAFLWLRLPDASAAWVMLTVLVSLAIVVVVGGGESWLLLSLAARPRTRVRLALGIALLIVGAFLWHESVSLIEHYSANDELLAGYVNSRFHQHARYFFTYDHIMLWMQWGWETLQTLFDGIILALCMAPVAAIKPLPAITRTLRSLAYWIAVFLFIVLADWLSGLLEHWLPGHGLAVESLSLVLRLLAVVAIDLLSLSFLLTVVAVCVRRSNALYMKAPAGTPDLSQPSTTVMP